MNDEEFRGAVIGMILGDGHINLSQRSTNGHIDFAHGAKQRDYAIWKASILEYLTSVRITEGISKIKSIGKEYPHTRVLTKTHPLYTHLWKRFYHNGRKTIDEFLMAQLTPMGLAIWYQDDGTLENRERFLTPTIQTNWFNVLENRLMSKSLADKFHIEFRVQKLNAKYLKLTLRRKDRETFFDIIRPYIQPCLLHKIRDDGHRSITGSTRNIELRDDLSLVATSGAC